MSTPNQLMSWFDDKELLSEVGTIGWNFLKKTLRTII